MKLFRSIIFVVCALLLANYLIPSNSETFVTNDPLTNEEKDKISEYRKSETIDSPKEYPIENFSIDSSDLSFAVLYCYDTIESSLNRSEVKEVCVYNADGSLKYAVRALYSGSVEILLDNGLLYILPHRGDVVSIYDADGKLSDMVNIANYRDEYEEKFKNKKTIVGNLTYSMEDRAFGLAPSYQVLKATDSNGNDKILYQSKFGVNFGDAFMLATIIVFLVCAIPIILYKRKNI